MKSLIPSSRFVLTLDYCVTQTDGNKSIRVSEIIKYLEEKKVDVESNYAQENLRTIFGHILGFNHGNVAEWRVNNADYVMLPNAYLDYVDVRELTNATEAAIEAKHYSNVAIGLALLSLLSSIVIGAIQLNDSQKIDSQQYERLLNQLDTASSKNDAQLEKINQSLGSIKKSNQEIISKFPNATTP